VGVKHLQDENFTAS